MSEGYSVPYLKLTRPQALAILAMSRAVLKSHHFDIPHALWNERRAAELAFNELVTIARLRHPDLAETYARGD